MRIGVSVPARHDGHGVIRALHRGGALVVEVRELVELPVGEQVEVQEGAGEGRVRGARLDAEERGQRAEEVRALLLELGFCSELGRCSGRGSRGRVGLGLRRSRPGSVFEDWLLSLIVRGSECGRLQVVCKTRAERRPWCRWRFGRAHV